MFCEEVRGGNPVWWPKFAFFSNFFRAGALFRVFHSNESRAGKGRETGNLRSSLKNDRTIYFSPKKTASRTVKCRRAILRCQGSEIKARRAFL
ncbi:MAG: hypothetical protein D6714_21115 [Bacteroidetes bacterium]|nr:MAG: hypothetical protein D6714_21115 [Bacteroidota bacterium]